MLRICVYTLVGWTALAVAASGVKTERWEFTSPESFFRGELTHLRVTSDGELRPGWAAEKVGEFAKQLWCAVADNQGTIYVGTSGPAAVYAIAPQGAPRKLWTFAEVAVTTIVMDRHGNVYAATIPDGKIWRVRVAGDEAVAELVVTLPAAYVWALLFDADGNLFAGTGNEGRIFRINTATGAVDEWYRVAAANVLCLAWDIDRSLLAGASERGQLYRIRGRHDGTVLHQFAEDEVYRILPATNRMWVAVNRVRARRPPMPAPRLVPAAAEAPDGAEDSRGRPAPGVEPGGIDEMMMAAEMRAATLLSGALYSRESNGRVDVWMTWERESVLEAAVDRDGDVWVATSGQGRVYRVRGPQRWELVFDFPERNAQTLAMHGGRLAFVGTSVAGVGYRVAPQLQPHGVFVTEVLDARFPTTWGNATWVGDGTIRVQARSGNTNPPDETWSGWSREQTRSPGALACPPARFLQVRVMVEGGPEAVLKNLRVYYQAQNQRPSITALRVDGEERRAARAPRPRATESRAAETAESEEEKDETASTPSTPTSPSRKPSPIKQITWQATDRDGDRLVYRLFYRERGREPWIPVLLERPLTKTSFAWDTESVPDGWYQIKLEASDEESNPVGQALTDERISGWVKVDNTRPRVEQLRWEQGQLRGRAVDEFSVISALEYSINGGPWRSLPAADGVLDDLIEEFAVQLPEPLAGSATIAVRATDEEGNTGTARIVVELPLRP